MTQNTIGVDVSKNWIDIFDPETGYTQLSNNHETLAPFAHQLANSGHKVIFEATGSYDFTLRHALDDAKVQYSRVNPARARHFARANGVLGKTDRVDARLLSQMGTQLDLAVSPPKSREQEELKALFARRSQFVEMRKQERTRQKQNHNPIVEKSIQRSIKMFTREIKAIEKAMAEIVEKDAEMKANYQWLKSAPGVGPAVAMGLIAELPELGQMDRRALAALAGVAPLARDSGLRSPKRHIRGGRPQIRRLLNVAALVASHSDPRMKAFRKRLEEKGKTPKQAIIAVARKLLTILNQMIKNGERYRII